MIACLNKTAASLLGCLALLGAAWAAEAPAGDDEANGPAPGLQLKPVVIDSSSAQRLALGLDYRYSRELKVETMLDAPPGRDPYDVPSTLQVRELLLAGTLASSAALNPNKLLDFEGNWRWGYKPRQGLSASAGLRLKAETDQSFDNRQWLYGAQLHTHLHAPVLPFRGWSYLYLNLARVNPGEDTLRQAALGGAKLRPYPRIDAEWMTHFNLRGSALGFTLNSFEVLLRHFQEVGPKDAIRAAGLDRQRLAAVRLNLAQGADVDGLFIQFSRGSLPFDKQSDRALKLGWSVKMP